MATKQHALLAVLFVVKACYTAPTNDLALPETQKYGGHKAVKIQRNV